MALFGSRSEFVTPESVRCVTDSTQEFDLSSLVSGKDPSRWGMLLLTCHPSTRIVLVVHCCPRLEPPQHFA